MKRREVLPRQTSGVRRARADVRSQEGPLPRLGNTGLEPHRHREEAAHLAEDHLLTSLRGNRLRQQLADFTGIKVVDKPPGTRLTPPGQALVEVDKLTDSGEWVVVCALRRSSLTQHVGKEGGMASFLISHELDQSAVLSSEACSKEIRLGEDSQAVVEEIELDPFLVQTQGDGFVVEVTLYHVPRQRAICA